MRREKFIYNTQTLRYEKVEESLSSKALRVFGFICAALLTAFIFTLIAHRFFPSPKEKALMGEIEQLETHYGNLVAELDRMQSMVENLQERDAYAHRIIFGMDPIDKGIWEGGVGGHDQYKDLREFKYSGELMASVQQKVDKLKRQMVLQSKSLDTIANLAREKEDLLAAMPSIKPVRGDKLARKVRYLSGFGMRIHPIFKVKKMHYGIDFTAPRGTPIQATGAGVVEKAEFSSSFGNHVIIDHGFGYKTLYAHMQSISVKRGDEVVRGETIGVVGSTGRSTAPHCHYEVHYKGKPVNPVHYCMDGLEVEEYKELVESAEMMNQSLD